VSPKPLQKAFPVETGDAFHNLIERILADQNKILPIRFISYLEQTQGHLSVCDEQQAPESSFFLKWEEVTKPWHFGDQVENVADRNFERFHDDIDD
jgi:hypothetical protein